MRIQPTIAFKVHEIILYVENVQHSLATFCSHLQ